MGRRNGAIGLAASLAVLAGAGAAAGASLEEGVLAKRAKGTFEVRVTPAAEPPQGGVASGELALEKAFAGGLVGTSKGVMWTADTEVEGSGGYVAIEKVEAVLDGRRGGFTLLHQGTMRRGGDFEMRLVVVPDSGTGELAGLSGTMSIVIADGKHYYDLSYTLSDGG